MSARKLNTLWPAKEKEMQGIIVIFLYNMKIHIWGFMQHFVKAGAPFVPRK